MSKIEIDGFLSDENEKFRKNVYLKYRDVFDFAKDLNRFSMFVMQKQKVDWKDKEKFIIKTLFLKTIENFQGTFLMLERGMMPQAKVLTRTMLETVFILVALQKKPELIQCYLDQHEEGTKRNLKFALQYNSEQLRKHAKEYKLEKLYIEKKEALKGKELKILSPKQWAIEAGLDDFYNVNYVLYSNSTHSNLSALNDHVDETEKETNLAFGPSEKDLYEVLQCCIYLLINAAKCTALVHGDDISQQLDNYKTKITNFDNQYLKKSNHVNSLDPKAL